MKPSQRSLVVSLLCAHGAAALALGVVACNDVERPVAKPAVPAPPPPSPPAPPVPPPMPVAVPTPPVVGMEDPFKLLNSAGARTLNLAWRAVRESRHADARALFHELVTAYPDKPAARFQELRMAALEGDLAAVPALWRELLARDFVGYSQRLDGDKAFAPLRKSPHGAEIKAITAEAKKAFTAGLAGGVFFVARLHPYAGPQFVSDNQPAKLDLDQEVYHFDPGSQRIRRVSDTGGKVLALHHDEERGQLMLLLAGKLKKVEGSFAFAEPAVALMTLATLERTRPVLLDTDAKSVDLCFSGGGEPIWAATPTGALPGKVYTFDATRTQLVASEETCGAAVATTTVSPIDVEHLRPDPEGVALSEDGLRLSGVDEERPIRASTPLRPGSFGWSPGKKRFVYSGTVNRCELATQPAPSVLFVWDSEMKRALQVKSAVSTQDARWIDDDLLAFEAGKGRATKVVVHDFSPGGLPVTVHTPAGSGLHGIPALGCAEAEFHALSL